ncbi:hypothetical protein Tco_0448170 [Tanacetum coccineum]
MLDLNPTLHDLQKVVADQKKKHYKTKHSLNIVDEEFKNVKSKATTKIRKQAKEEYGIPKLRVLFKTTPRGQGGFEGVRNVTPSV